MCTFWNVSDQGIPCLCPRHFKVGKSMSMKFISCCFVDQIEDQACSPGTVVFLTCLWSNYHSSWSSTECLVYLGDTLQAVTKLPWCCIYLVGIWEP